MIYENTIIDYSLTNYPVQLYVDRNYSNISVVTHEVIVFS